MIRVQTEPFDVNRELEALKHGRHKVGASAIFVGSVRDLSDGAEVNAMTLEHYPGMTQKALEKIEADALARWPLDGSLIIHRYGRLEPGDDIVLVITTSSHREAAFQSCEFLMDWLKTKAPFWKLEEGEAGKGWVDAAEKDTKAVERWTNDNL